MGVWASVLVTLAIQALGSLVVFSPPVLVPAARADLAIPSGAVGVCTALIYLSAATGALLSAGAIPRHGPLRVSQCCLLLCAAGIALMSAAWAPLAALGALVIGFGYGPMTPSSSAILAERVPPHLRAFIFSVKQSGVPLGGMLAGATLPGLIGLWGWRTAALCTAAACLLLALLVQPWRRGADAGFGAHREVARTGLLASLRLVMGQPALRSMALASFTYSGMQMSLGSFLVVYLHDRLAYTLPMAGAALSAAMVAGAVGRVFWGVVADRLEQPRRLLALLGLAMSVSAWVTAAFTPAWPVAAVFAVSVTYGATAVGWNGIYLSEVARMVPPAQAAAATGASLAMTYTGVVAMPLLFTLLLGLSGSYVPAFAAAGALTLWRSVALLRGL